VERFDSRGWSGSDSDDGSCTSTELARTYGLTGEWAVAAGHGPMYSFASHDCVTSRLSARDIGLSVDDPRTIPAVRGITAWPGPRTSKAVVSFPNLMGVMEPLDRVLDYGSLGVVIHPDLAGALSLPTSTGVVMLMIGPEPMSLVPGDATSLRGKAGSLCGRDRRTRDAIAAEATQRARLLAKHVTQISGVEVVGEAPSTGRLVVTTPSPPSAVLEDMQHMGIVGGRPAELPEYPGAIVVECRPDHDESALMGFANALSTALGTTRRIGR